MHKIIAPLLLLLAGLAHGQVYVCDDNGHKTFSQQPCGSNAQEVQVQNGGGNVTISPDVTQDDALSICKLSFRAVEIANQLSHESINAYTARQRIVDFLKEHITNYSQVLRANPAFSDAIQQQATRLTNAGYSIDTMTDEERESATGQCARSVYEDLSKNKVNSSRSGDKTL